MKDHEQFTIDGLCDVEVKSQPGGWNRPIHYATARNDTIEIDFLRFLPEGWRIQSGAGAHCNPVEKIVQINEVPDIDEFSDLPDADLFRNSMRFDWLLTALHEVGHAHNQYEYADDVLASRDRASTVNAYSSLQDMTDTLHDEMGAWAFALDKLNDLGIIPEKRMEACLRITSMYLSGYVSSALNPMKIHGIRGVKPAEYVETIVSLYQKWLDATMPDFGVDYTKVRALKEKKERSFLKLKKLFDEGAQVIGLHLSRMSADFLSSLVAITGTSALYKTDGTEVPEFGKSGAYAGRVNVEIKEGEPKGPRSVQLVDNSAQSQSDHTYSVILSKDLWAEGASPQIVSLRRHLYVGDLGKSILFDFAEVNVPELFGIDSLRGYDGLVIQ